MSLVNDMLRDLASQHEKQPRISGDSDVLLAESSLLKLHRFRWLPSLIVFVVVLLLLLSTQTFFSDDETFYSAPYTQVDAKNLSDRPVQTGSEDHIISEAATVSEAQIAAKKSTAEQLKSDLSATTPTGAAKDVAVAVPVSGGNEAVDENRTPKINERVFELVRNAERAFVMDRLTSPIEDNAWQYYQDILTILPDSEVAKEGLARIAERYITLADAQLAKGNYQGARALAERAKFVAPQYPAIANLEQLIAHGEAEYSLASSTRTASQVQPKSSVTETSPVVEKLSVSSAASTTSSLRSAIDRGIQPNAKWQDEQAVAQAQDMLNKNRVGAAKEFLQAFIAENSQAASATQLLFDLYVQQSDIAAAEQLLAQAQDDLSALDQIRLGAQLLVAQGNEEAAIAGLEQHLNEAVNDEDYRALLAGLYYKVQRYQASANAYRRLLEVFGEKPAYWLGLGLASDALHQKAIALAAFRRISPNAMQQQEIKNYVAQRIAALSN